MNHSYQFRAWDSANHRWVSRFDLIDPHNIPVIPTKQGFRLQSTFILSQCTGIQDRLKRDIYEGDILKGLIATGHSRSAKKKEWFAEVKWNDWSHGWDMSGKTDSRWRFFPTFQSCEVVGNIWETPELVKR